MDDILPKLLTFPQHPPPPNALSDQQYDEGIRAQISVVKNITPSKLLQKTSGGESALDIINPSVNSVPYTFILKAHIEAAQRNDKTINAESLWNSIISFLTQFDQRQMRYMGHELSQIINVFSNIARRHNQIPGAIPHIRDALLRFDPTGTLYTPTRLLLVQLAMESQQYDAVLPIIDSTILYIPGASDKPTPKYLCSMALSPVAYITLQSGFSTKQIKSVDLLEYFLLSGMVYIGLRRWQRARECLELAVTYPSRENGCSILMSEAYKKWILIRVLLDGKAPTLPKHISTNLAKSLHTLAKPYETVAQIFEQGTASRLKSELEAGRGIWTTDCNVGLVMCVMAAYQQFQIRNLANVHTKLTMVDIHNLTQSAELGSKLPNVTAVETLISSMIADGTLHATLSHPPNQSPVLTFSQSGPLLSEKQTQAALAVSTSRLKSLTDEIKATDRMMTYEKEYVKYAQKVKKTLAMDQAVGVNEVEWSGIDDEDLMGSLY